MKALACLLLLGLCACVAQDLPPRGGQSPILHEAARTKSADKLAVFVPGALNSVAIFRTVLSWRDAGYAVAFYRFPGYDGLPVDHHLDIEDAGLTIAEFVNKQQAREIRLVGYSTGGPVVLEAAKHVKQRDLMVAAISSAVPFPSSISTALRGANNIGRIASKLGTFDKDRIWKQYYQVLLYGERGLEVPELKETIAKTTEKELKNVKVPPDDLINNHTGDLRFWQLQNVEDLSYAAVRFYHGLEDPIFSTQQTKALARRLPNVEIIGYPTQGHLLFLTAPRVFDDILGWFEGG